MINSWALFTAQEITQFMTYTVKENKIETSHRSHCYVREKTRYVSRIWSSKILYPKKDHLFPGKSLHNTHSISSLFKYNNNSNNNNKPIIADADCIMLTGSDRHAAVHLLEWYHPARAWYLETGRLETAAQINALKRPRSTDIRIDSKVHGTMVQPRDPEKGPKMKAKLADVRYNTERNTSRTLWVWLKPTTW